MCGERVIYIAQGADVAKAGTGGQLPLSSSMLNPLRFQPTTTNHVDIGQHMKYMSFALHTIGNPWSAMSERGRVSRYLRERERENECCSCLRKRRTSRQCGAV